MVRNTFHKLYVKLGMSKGHSESKTRKVECLTTTIMSNLSITLRDKISDDRTKETPIEWVPTGYSISVLTHTHQPSSGARRGCTPCLHVGLEHPSELSLTPRPRVGSRRTRSSTTRRRKDKFNYRKNLSKILL